MVQFDDEFDQNDIFKFKELKNTDPTVNLKFVYEFSTMCPYCSTFIGHSKESIFLDHFKECQRVNSEKIEKSFAIKYMKMFQELFHNILYKYNRYYFRTEQNMRDYEQTLYEMDDKVLEIKKLKQNLDELTKKYRVLQSALKKISTICSATNEKIEKLLASD